MRSHESCVGENSFIISGLFDFYCVLFYVQLTNYVLRTDIVAL